MQNIHACRDKQLHCNIEHHATSAWHTEFKHLNPRKNTKSEAAVSISEVNTKPIGTLHCVVKQAVVSQNILSKSHNKLFSAKTSLAPELPKKDFIQTKWLHCHPLAADVHKFCLNQLVPRFWPAHIYNNAPHECCDSTLVYNQQQSGWQAWYL